MKKTAFILLFIPIFFGFAPVNKTVCYICKLVDKPRYVNIGFSFYEPGETIRFEVINFNNDPLKPKFINVKVEGGIYYRDFFKEGCVYSVVAKDVSLPVYYSYRPMVSLYYSLPNEEKIFSAVSIVTSE